MEKLKEILFLKNLKGIGKSSIYKKYWEILVKANGIKEIEDYIEEKEPKYSFDDMEIARKKAEHMYNEIVGESDITVITVLDEDYPAKLKDMGTTKPLIIYVKGDVKALNTDNIAIIGTRKPSEWSTKVEQKLVQKIISASGRTIVSGLALGCDKIAHETTVRNGAVTVAVLPSGVNVITPASHKNLAEEILKNNGCILSEYEPNEKANKMSFVERDAIVAALSDITFVVECNVKSGTMHTVNAAGKYNRKIACYYPDNMERGSYDGNQYIVKEKNAFKISNTEDLLELLKKDDKSAEFIEEPHQMSLFDMT